MKRPIFKESLRAIMSSVMDLKCIEDTVLWKRLNSGFNANTEDSKVANVLATHLKEICQYAADRMKNIPSLCPEYTLHDETHLLRVTELMAKVIPKEVLEKLNPIELGLLILSAYYHDQGMILSKEEIESLSNDPEFEKFSKNWEVEHPNLTQIRQRSKDKSLSSEELRKCGRNEQELLEAQLTDYIRLKHGRRSAEFVKSQDNNLLWKIAGTNLAFLVAKLCKSHVEPAYNLMHSKGFYHDQSVGQYSVNMIYLGLVLRLADILDLDRDRTPDALYKDISFTNEVSLREWEKHRSVEGWKIDSEDVRFTMRCEHPIYQRTALEFMNWIDMELAATYDVSKNLPTWSDYYFNLPLKCNRSRIEPKDEAYIYYDLEFSLSRDEIVKLLMMEGLYQSPSLCVRELMQNSLDALRHRKALFKRDSGTNWAEGRIKLVHTIDADGHEILRCIDNGTGMDGNIVENFLTKVGRSYYQSYEFKQERVSFRDADVDFDPCSQFGIGFMSCFMIGDHITIHTRRDYGPRRGLGDPLIVEINGLSGMVVMRKGSQDQDAGTTIEIKGRIKPLFFDKWNDTIQLIAVVKGYALACEFIIEASCEIPEIKSQVTIPPGIEIPQTEMERAGIPSIKTFEQDFSEIDTNLAGLIRLSILIDREDNLAIENNEAKWMKPITGSIGPSLTFGKDVVKDWETPQQICMDGILVCGDFGRQVHLYNVTHYSTGFYLGKDCFILAVRGLLKPPLKAARCPLNQTNSQINYSWDRLRYLAGLAHGRLWEKVALSFNGDSNFEVFWQLVAIHQAEILYMRSGKIWSHISVPVALNGEEIEWRKISSLGKLSVIQNADSFKLITHDGAEIKSYDTIDQWNSSHGPSINRLIKDVVLSMSTVVLDNSQIFLEIREPIFPDRSPEDFKLISAPISLPYAGSLRDTLSVQLPFKSI